MTGNSENNRSERQGWSREAASTKEVCSKGTTVGKRTEQRGRARAMSVLGNAKSNQHRKTRTVEPGGTGRKFMHLMGALTGENPVRATRSGRIDHAIWISRCVNMTGLKPTANLMQSLRDGNTSFNYAQHSRACDAHASSDRQSRFGAYRNAVASSILHFDIQQFKNRLRHRIVTGL